MSFGKNLKKCRIEAQLTQSQLADMLKIHRNNIHRWECGKITPTIDTLKKLSRTLEVSVDKLLFSEDELKK